MNENIEHLKYPIGRFKFPEDINQEQAKQWISEIETLPEQLAKLVKPLDERQLNCRYREGGWTVRQIVHHLFDRHILKDVLNDHFSIALDGSILQEPSDEHDP